MQQPYLMVQTGNFIPSVQNYNHPRLLPGRGKIVKHWLVRGYKKVGDHWFKVYLSNTYC